MTNSKNTKKSLTFDSGTLLLHSNGGFTLFYAMLISSLLLSIGLAIFNITYKEFILTTGIRESEGAFYAADSALECALYWDYIHGGSGAPAFGFYGDSLASGLVGYWRFEEEEPNLIDAIDSSGQGNTGDLFGDTITTTRVPGQIGNALPFNGVDEFFNTTAGLALGASNAHTVSARFKINTLPTKEEGNAWVLLLGEDTNGTHAWTIDFEGTLQIGEPGGSFVGVSLKDPTGWNHVIATYDGSSFEVYINGENTGGESPAFNGLRAPQLTLGKSFDGGTYFNGELDDVRVYNRALSALDEIPALFAGTSNNMFVPPVASTEDGGVALTCSGTVINDPNVTEGGTTGWVPEGGVGNWTIIPSEPVDESKTIFDMTFDDDTCALVEVTKRVDGVNDSSTEIISRGYNTCELNSKRRLERAIRATY